MGSSDSNVTADEVTPFRLAMITTLWGRSKLSQIVLDHYANLEVDGVEFTRVAVWSPEDSDLGSMLETPEWNFVRSPNMPVSDKWNAAALFLRRRTIDAFMIFGSDDFINSEYIRLAVDAIRGGADYAMPTSLHFADIESRSAFYRTNIGRVGAGRIVSKLLLRKLQYRPWATGFLRFTDGAMDQNLARVGHPTPDVRLDDISSRGACILDCKSEVNEHAFEAMKSGPSCVDVDYEATLRQYFPASAKRLLALS